jgi:Domain of unknown function (DUF4386)
MTTTFMTEQIAEATPRFTASGFKARDFRASGFGGKVAGVVYLASLLAATFAEIFVRGLGVGGALMAVSGMIAAMLLFYNSLSAVSQRLAVLAFGFNVLGLVFEAVRLQPQGANIAVVFNGFCCILIGCLVFRSSFQPRILGAFMALGGVGWLTLVSPSLAHYLSPYNLAFGILGEGAVCVWVLLAGVEVQGWNERASGAGAGVISGQHSIR